MTIVYLIIKLFIDGPKPRLIKINDRDDYERIKGANFMHYTSFIVNNMACAYLLFLVCKFN